MLTYKYHSENLKSKNCTYVLHRVAWFMIHDVWSVVCGVWRVVCGAWSTVRGIPSWLVHCCCP